MLKYIFIISLIFNFSILNGSVTRSYNTKVVQGEGTGTTRAEAINNAIADALGQLNGVDITQKIFTKDISIESSRGDNYSYQYNKKISKITKGRLDSYKIIDVEEVFERRFRAVIEAKKTTSRATYKAPGISPKHRRSVAVLPFHTT